MIERKETVNIVWSFTKHQVCFLFVLKNQKNKKETQGKYYFDRDLSNPGDMLKPSVESHTYYTNTKKKLIYFKFPGWQLEEKLVHSYGTGDN